MEWFVMVRVSDKEILREDRFYLFESLYQVKAMLTRIYMLDIQITTSRSTSTRMLPIYRWEP